MPEPTLGDLITELESLDLAKQTRRFRRRLVDDVGGDDERPPPGRPHRGRRLLEGLGPAPRHRDIRPQARGLDGQRAPNARPAAGDPDDSPLES